jgi:hypothetical protein
MKRAIKGGRLNFGPYVAGGLAFGPDFAQLPPDPCPTDPAVVALLEKLRTLLATQKTFKENGGTV